MGGLLVKAANHIEFSDETLFRSVTYGALPFREAFKRILQFLAEEPDCSYCISVGSDSQSNSESSVLVTCVLVHRKGHGAIGFFTRNYLRRPLPNIREKLSLETLCSLQLAYLFDEERLSAIYDVLSGRGGVELEFHIDAGEKGPTRAYLSELIGMAKGLAFIPRVKPESVCASCYADRHSKVL
jgi:predicted RNase H-related nuclease YkuK (DUF458 family)